MSSITIGNLDTSIKERLSIRAAEYGHSMEAEARRIPRTAWSVNHTVFAITSLRAAAGKEDGSATGSPAIHGCAGRRTPPGPIRPG